MTRRWASWPTFTPSRVIFSVVSFEVNRRAAESFGEPAGSGVEFMIRTPELLREDLEKLKWYRDGIAKALLGEGALPFLHEVLDFYTAAIQYVAETIQDTEAALEKARGNAP